jgi:hypothetical protein
MVYIVPLEDQNTALGTFYISTREKCGSIEYNVQHEMVWPIQKMTMGPLRILARHLGVPQNSKLKRAELLAAIEPRISLAAAEESI